MRDFKIQVSHEVSDGENTFEVFVDHDPEGGGEGNAGVLQFVQG